MPIPIVYGRVPLHVVKLADCETCSSPMLLLVIDFPLLPLYIPEDLYTST